MNGKALEARSGPKTAGQIRLPFFYGWLLVGVSFVTMAIGVNARTAYSLLFPQILDEFGWDRGVTAGAFSFGFLVSAVVTPCVGWLTDRRGPRLVIETGVVLMGTGLLLATLIREPWQLYLTLGALVGGVNLLAYTGQSLYLTNWFVRRRGLALSIAFSGVGVGSVTILPWLQILIANSGWRTACWSFGVLLVVILAPLNLLLRRSPANLGLEPDGISDSGTAVGTRSITNTSRLRMTGPLVPSSAAWALGLVSLVAVPGQIALGHLSDRIGREWVWSIGNGGFVLSCVALLALDAAPSAPLRWVMVVTFSAISIWRAAPPRGDGVCIEGGD
jgi:MFS family permease